MVLADGYSCRTQIEQGDTRGRQGMHLAELLAAGLGADAGSGRPEDSFADRPMTSTPARAIAQLAVGVGLTAAAVLAVGLVRRGRQS